MKANTKRWIVFLIILIILNIAAGIIQQNFPHWGVLCGILIGAYAVWSGAYMGRKKADEDWAERFNKRLTEAVEKKINEQKK